MAGILCRCGELPNRLILTIWHTEPAGQRGPWSLDFRQVTQARSATPTAPLKPRVSGVPPPRSAIHAATAHAAPTRADLEPQRLGANQNCTRSPPQPALPPDLVQLNRVSTPPAVTRSLAPCAYRRRRCRILWSSTVQGVRHKIGGTDRARAGCFLAGDHGERPERPGQPGLRSVS